MPGCRMKFGSPILPKSGCCSKVLCGIKKEGKIYNLQANTYYLVEKMVTVSAVDTEIIGLKGLLKKNTKCK